MPFTPKDWRNAATYSGGGDISTPLNAPALEDMETRVTNYTNERVGALVYDVREFGATGDGTTDDRAAIQDAINFATALGGGVVYLPPGSYNIGSTPGLRLKDKVELKGAGMGATELVTSIDMGISSAGLDDNAVIGSFGATYPTGLSSQVAATLSANADPGDQTITLSSTTGLVVDEWYMLGSDDRLFSGSGYRAGEFVRIKSVDSGTQVTIWSFVRGTYTTANSAKLYNVGFIRCGVSDLRVRNANFDNTQTRLIRLTGVQDFNIERVLMLNGDVAGVTLLLCRDGRVQFTARNFNNNAGASRNGYGIHVMGLSENIEIDCNMRHGRSGVTSGTAGNIPGVARGVVVTGVASEMTGTAFDTHGNAEGWIFNNCHAFNCVLRGFQVRGLNTQLIGCSAINCGFSINLPGSGTLGTATDTTLIGCTFRKALVSTDGGDGNHVMVENGAKRIRFIGCSFDGSWAHNVLVAGQDVRFLNCEFANPGQSGTNQRAISTTSNCSGLYVKGCTFVCYTTGTEDTQSSGNGNPEAINLVTGTTGCFVAADNRVSGEFTEIAVDSGTGNTVEGVTNPYTVTNPTTDRTLNVTGDTTAQVAQVLGTLITDLKARDLIG